MNNANHTEVNDLGVKKKRSEPSQKKRKKEKGTCTFSVTASNCSPELSQPTNDHEAEWISQLM